MGRLLSGSIYTPPQVLQLGARHPKESIAAWRWRMIYDVGIPAHSRLDTPLKIYAEIGLHGFDLRSPETHNLRQVVLHTYLETLIQTFDIPCGYLHDKHTRHTQIIELHDAIRRSSEKTIRRKDLRMRILALPLSRRPGEVDGFVYVGVDVRDPTRGFSGRTAAAIKSIGYILDGSDVEPDETLFTYVGPSGTSEFEEVSSCAAGLALTIRRSLLQHPPGWKLAWHSRVLKGSGLKLRTYKPHYSERRGVRCGPYIQAEIPGVTARHAELYARGSRHPSLNPECRKGASKLREPAASRGRVRR